MLIVREEKDTIRERVGIGGHASSIYQGRYSLRSHLAQQHRSPPEEQGPSGSLHPKPCVAANALRMPATPATPYTVCPRARRCRGLAAHHHSAVTEQLWTPWTLGTLSAHPARLAGSHHGAAILWRWTPRELTKVHTGTSLPRLVVRKAERHRAPFQGSQTLPRITTTNGVCFWRALSRWMIWNWYSARRSIRDNLVGPGSHLIPYSP